MYLIHSINSFMSRKSTKSVLIIPVILIFSMSIHAAPLYVDHLGSCGGNTPCYTDIQTAIDNALDGDTIIVYPGTYTTPLNIEGFTGLTVEVASADTVTLQPTSTLDWGDPYGSSRQVGVRVYDSMDVTIDGLIMDFAIVTANMFHGLLYWDSSGTVQNNDLMNLSLDDASGYYYEITSYFRADDYSPSTRLPINVLNNTFIDTGRLGICTHTYVDMTIEGNTFYKTFDDFGYAMELGSASIAEVRNNTIYEYDTPALSDDSASAGIYIENSFTSAESGITKNMLLEGNEIYNCQFGLYIGNEFDGYAGDVDIVIDAFENNIHDNTDGGMVITDEDASAGSSVSVYFHENSIINNPSEGTGYAYQIHPNGDGDITALIENDFINGHEIGVAVGEEAPGNTISVAVHQCDLSGNTCGTGNDVTSIIVDASGNWWGNRNPSAVAAQAGLYVDYTPWLHHSTDTSGDPGFQPRLSNMHVDDDSPQTGTVTRIQEGIDMVESGGIVTIEAGNYVEDLDVYKSVNLTGAGATSTILEPVGNQYDYVYSTSTHILVYAEDVSVTNVHLAGTEGVCDTGIIVEDTNGSQPVVVSNILIQYCDIHNYGSEGIHIIGDNDTITGIQILDNDVHDMQQNLICLAGGCDDAQIFCNEIFSGTHYGVRISRRTGSVANSNVLVNWNNIFDNDEAGLQVESSAHSTQLNAENNWWNHDSGPGGDGPGSGDAVFGWVDYFPWLLSEQMDPCPPPPIPTLSPIGLGIVIALFTLAIWGRRKR